MEKTVIQDPKSFGEFEHNRSRSCGTRLHMLSGTIASALMPDTTRLTLARATFLAMSAALQNLGEEYAFP